MEEFLFNNVFNVRETVLVLFFERWHSDRGSSSTSIVVRNNHNNNRTNNNTHFLS